MSDAIEMRVRTIVADVLRALPENIRPETMLLAGVVAYGQIRSIAHRIELTYDIQFGIYDPELWTSVGDIVLATERALAANSREAA